MTEPRSFTAMQRIELFSRSNGECQKCGAPITLTDFHADHVIPWSKGGKTTLANGQALCRPCNLNKSATMEIPYQMHLPAGWTLRAWQEEFVNRYLSSAIQQINKPPSEINAFILHAFPGAGKSLAQCLVARTLIEQGYIDQVIFCVPSKLLREQMVDDAAKVGLTLNGKRLDTTGFMGIVTSYAQIGYVDSKETGKMVNAELLRKICAERPTMVIADEMHHLGRGKNWGDAFELAFDQHAVARLMTSGTPFRSDSSTLPWCRYSNKKIDLSPPHAYSYGYGLSQWNSKFSALGDRVVRDVVVHPWDGEVNFTVKRYEHGEFLEERTFTHRLTDNIDELYPDVFEDLTGPDDEPVKLIDNRRLRQDIKSKRRLAAIECGTPAHPYGTDYVRDQLVTANDQLKDVRRSHPWAGGLIVCNSIVHADSVAKALKHWTGEDSVVIHSESGAGARAIKEFRGNRTEARTKWIVSVGKISEGVDIKHLRVCVYLSRIQAPLRWTQILGRVLRVEDDLDWDLQTAHLYQYDDGMELVEDEDGEVTSQSVNIKMFAETLLEERWVTLEASEKDRKQPGGVEGGGDGEGKGNYSTVEAHSASGVNTQTIYEGQRHENSDLEPWRILAARLTMPTVKVASLVAKGGIDEWVRALNEAKEQN